MEAQGAQSSAESVDLVERIRLGMNCLLGCLDPTRRHVPYWNCTFAGGDVGRLTHAGPMDLMHNVPRALHALCMAQEATGEALDPEVLRDLTEHQLALFDEADELPGALDEKTGGRTVHLHNVRENLHGLTALIRRGERRAERWARRLVRRLLGDAGRGAGVRLEELPPYVEGRTCAPHGLGRALDALVRYCRVSGDEAALDLSQRIAAYSLERCFTEHGTLTEEAGTHGHSINALVAGLADLGLLTREADLLERTRRIYEVGLPRFNSSFGWSMESLTRFTLRGESNNTGDLLRAALLLGKAGWTRFFQVAERILRGHLLPSQVLGVEGFSDAPDAAEDCRRSLASRIRGGFSFPTPNDYLVAPDAPIVTFDITSGAVDGLCEALFSCLTEDEAGVRVNLLFSRCACGVRVRSGLSARGRIEMQNPTGRNLLVRLPHWVAPESVRLSAEGAELPVRVVNGYLMVPARHDRAEVEFPMRRRRTEESISYQRFTIDWLGDEIVAMSPAAKHLPMFPPCEPA